ncbi:efflux RND transporter periplasmic adaptor subunit [Rhizobium ruizarguesonis]|uniref:efflux RND transporter periplasmic adaptor subunit n=1 Tax=Rhizobium ruizarguesonis TaxID=2081791 RepID=UPI0010310406|nr:efflux RND transporter periplasmic adaptor subunit [Rhizobium ruizarguesonis]TBA09119.1 efflux RND transporter periplasmic adaptor subunit [Rhizobium ruizarguesonis]TBB62042.1 efflux RND transporter periplasmic adaptor subunit [Rhizobium ruizarguesonis]TBB81121.1 efflux RND transporter periplasmic adaptor subunit [Rhizobium ruizarguesonis]TBC26140.1 efflux RND transporter periplasmic adaptor subunit [Rhizobium ruizarguesonis]
MDQTVTDARARSERTVKKKDTGRHAWVPPGDVASNDAKVIGARPPSRPGRRFRRLGALVIVLAGICAVWLGNRYFVSHAVERFAIKPVDLTVELSGPGTLDATRISLVSSRLQGVIATMRVDRNDRVSQGDIVAEIVTDDLKSELGASLASVDAARKAVDLAKADREHAEAALTNAQSNFDRRKTLLEKRVASKESYDTAVSTLRQADADLKRSQAAIEQAKAQEEEAAATAAVQRVKLDDGTIRAPFEGVVVSRDHYVGDTITPGAEIVRLVDPASIILSARFDESSIYRLWPGQKAVIRFNGGGKGSSVTATVLRIGRQVDTETREFSVDLRPETLPPNWAVGQRAMTTIEIDTREGVLAVPTNAIERRKGKPGVWIIDSGRAYWIAITLGDTGGPFVEVVQGLEPGDVILSEPGDVYFGMKVAESGARR